MNRMLAYIVISLVLLAFQTTVVQLLSLRGITPDVLIVWVVYLALKEGQLRGTLWGFAIGLLMDLVSGDFLGLSALSKTICGFLGGYFYNENKTQITLGSYRFLLIVLAVAFVHNIVYFMIFTRGTNIPLWQVILQLGLATTLYTTVISIIPMFTFARKSSFST